MSRHKQFTVTHLNDYPLESRSSKVTVTDFAGPVAGDSFTEFIDSLPNILAARQLRTLATKIREARELGKPIIWGFGGHVIKVGLAPVLVDLMKRGFVSAFATNGSGMIHDFEVCLCGRTSEDVDRELGDGAFGMARETGELINQAINDGARAGDGIGEALGALLSRIPVKYPQASIFHSAFSQEIPCTVHLAIGTDIIHNHPSASGAALGQGSYVDFRIFTELVSRLGEGGVFLNLGSAVILPEVFLKAVTAIRNSGIPLQRFTTANLDFIQHYRPLQNVVRRPDLESGTGIALTGHHEIMVPLLAAMLIHEV